MESLQLLKTEATKVQKYKTGVSTITESDCVSGVALACNPCKTDYTILIGKGISKMFFLHGVTYTPEMIQMFLESITSTYNYESPETILLFLQKAGNGNFGKFYGSPDIGTIRDWFADFLQLSIVPAREHKASQHKETFDNQREQKKSNAELIKQIQTPVTYEGEYKKGKVRKL